MARIGIFYGSSTGNTRDVSAKLQAVLDADLHNVAETEADAIAEYRYLVFATSTWGAGDLQDDWEEFFPHLDEMDFAGRKVAIMGLGDQTNYGDTFVDGMTILADKVVERGGVVVGSTSSDGYGHDASGAERNGRFVGLVIDEDNQSDRTDNRIRKWAVALKREFR